MNKTIPILVIVVFVAASFMVMVYFEPELIGLTRPHSRIGDDGVASKMALMINKQCLDKKENPFKDYAFARTSNGKYYIDNVICERINVEQGGCLEPFSKGFPDETCKNRVTFDFPYGETGPMMNQETCDNFVISQWQPTVEDREMVQQFLEICIQREFMTTELVERGKVADNFTMGPIQSASTSAEGDIEKTIKILEEMYKENEK